MRGWAIDLDQLLRGEALGSRPGPGGEWDCVRALPLQLRRRLQGGRLMRARGLAPDQLAEVVNDALRTDMSTDEACDWYVRHALLLLDQRAADRAAARDYRAEYLARDRAELQRKARVRARQRSRLVVAGATVRGSLDEPLTARVLGRADAG